MFKYDSVHGRFKGTVEAKDGKLWVEGQSIAVFAERNPADIKWGSVGADYIIESTVHIPRTDYITFATNECFRVFSRQSRSLYRLDMHIYPS